MQLDTSNLIDVILSFNIYIFASRIRILYISFPSGSGYCIYLFFQDRDIVLFASRNWITVYIFSSRIGM